MVHVPEFLVGEHRGFPLMYIPRIKRIVAKQLWCNNDIMVPEFFVGERRGFPLMYIPRIKRIVAKQLWCNNDIMVPEFFVGEHRGFSPESHVESNVPDSVLQLQVTGRHQLVHQKTILRYPPTTNASTRNCQKWRMKLEIDSFLTPCALVWHHRVFCDVTMAPLTRLCLETCQEATKVRFQEAMLSPSQFIVYI